MVFPKGLAEAFRHLRLDPVSRMTCKIFVPPMHPSAVFRRRRCVSQRSSAPVWVTRCRHRERGAAGGARWAHATGARARAGARHPGSALPAACRRGVGGAPAHAAAEPRLRPSRGRCAWRVGTTAPRHLPPVAIARRQRAVSNLARRRRGPGGRSTHGRGGAARRQSTERGQRGAAAELLATHTPAACSAGGGCWWPPRMQRWGAVGRLFVAVRCVAGGTPCRGRRSPRAGKRGTLQRR